ncbi:hypothetical protein [Sphingomonas sp. DT-204]|uniref:hypothetical protein n=1 Tax=Sphingomonas sp. DT-204 TaxID=3396166 RepID=UPI003F1C69CF
MFALFFAVVALFIGATYWLMLAYVRSRLRQVAALPVVADPDGSIDVPVAATFRGLKGIPWIAISHANVGHRLRLDSDGIEFKVIGAERHPYSDISSVDVRTAIGTMNVVIEFKSSLRSLAGNVASLANAAKVVDVLASRGCPLTPRAERVRREHAAAP